MLKKTAILSFFSLAALLLFWGFFFVRVRPQDLKVSRELHKTTERISSHTLATMAQQHRQGVIKDIYFTQEDKSRLHYQIQSESSELTIEPRGKNIEMIEKLEKIKCWMQDKLYYTSSGSSPMQQVRFLQADEGIYRHSTQQFLAHSVALSLYRLPEHTLPKEIGRTMPFLKGMAQDVSFGISGKVPKFQAQNFKAELTAESAP